MQTLSKIKYNERAFRHKMLRGVALFYRRYLKAPTPFSLSLDYPDVDSANEKIYSLLTAQEPCMVARYGNTELLTVCNYLGVKSPNRSFIKFVKGEAHPWWWDTKRRTMMGVNAGFFPLDDSSIEKFCQLMLQDTLELDLLGSWLKNEEYLSDSLNAVPKVSLYHLEPFFSRNPWTRALEGKKVLVVHPFSELIESQYYYKRKLLFDNPEMLPEFELQTFKAVQSIGGQGAPGFDTWFDALQWMEDEIDKRVFDIAIIGCGAYGFPLAAHIKRSGRKAFHLGGVTQMLWGIKGARWDRDDYFEGKYKSLFNENWVRPGDEFTPVNADKVEGACYW